MAEINTRVRDMPVTIRPNRYGIELNGWRARERTCVPQRRYPRQEIFDRSKKSWRHVAVIFFSDQSLVNHIGQSYDIEHGNS